MIAKLGGWVVGLALLAAAAGCGGPPAPASASMTLDRLGWDTLAVEVRFEGKGFLGTRRAVAAADTAVYLFDAAYDTLYAGDGRRIPVPDAGLGDREPLLVEVCGTFEAARLCEQQKLAASPKRLVLDHDIAYPDAGTFERGRYALRVVAERQAFEGTGWERLGPVPAFDGYLLAYVDEHAEEAVRVPLGSAEGRFDLSRHEGYDDFAFHLRSRLLDEEAANVHIDVYAGFEGQPPVRLASVEKQLRDKTPPERRREAYHFAEEAARQLLDRLDADEDADAFVFLDDWTFRPLTRTYTISFDVAWRHDRGFLHRSRRYRFTGTLDVREDGREASFRITDANRRAEDRWDDHHGRRTFRLRDLDPYVPDEDAEDAEALSER